MTVPNKPNAPTPRLDSIPELLRSTPRWVLWRYVWREKVGGSSKAPSGAWAKLPMQRNGKAARSTSPETWCSYDDAVKALRKVKCDGLGFVLAGDGLVGIDLDDCIDALDNLSPMAADLLATVPGYAEMSPSGTGLKLWTWAPGITRGYIDKAAGIEMYTTGRYFTVTGQELERPRGRGGLPRNESEKSFALDLTDEVQAWLARWKPGVDLTGDVDDADLDALRSPLDDWPLERLRDEVLCKLNPDCGYAEWVKIGMAMHHQYDGSAEALDAWDEWSQGTEENPCASYTPGYCEDKWDTFDDQHGTGVVTLRSVLELVKDHSVATSSNRIAEAIRKINAVSNVAEFEGSVARKIREAKLSDTEREQLAVAIQQRILAINGTRMPIATVRGWLRKKAAWNTFPDVNADGAPLNTHNNVQEVLNRMGAVVRYNVITKEDEILIPDEAYTMDNMANASLARVISECAKFEVPISQVKGYVTLLADQNQFNPVMTWIESSEWDGTDRVRSLLGTVHVKPEHAAMRDLLIHRWLLQAVAIANNTGTTQARGILTFQGSESKGKMRWLMSLAPEGHGFVRTGHTLDVRNKDSIKIAVSCWLLELGEVDTTFKRSEMGAIKAFASQSVDTFRKPFAHAEGSYPRRTALYASVNDEEFLYDTSGNTRFWTLQIESLDHEHDINMQQLWAQVLVEWRAGAKHWLDDEEIKVLIKSNEEFTVGDPVEDKIAERFMWPKAGEPIVGGSWLTATEILNICGVTKPTRGELVAAGRMVRKLNGGQKGKSTDRSSRKLLLVPPARGSADADFEDDGGSVL